VVLPDGAPTDRDRPSTGRRTLLVIAVLALAMGALTMGALTSPDPEAAVTTSTTTTTTTTPLDPPIDYDNFTVDQIAVGAQLDWRKVAQIRGGWRSDLVSQLGLLYLFTSSRVSINREPIGLQTYRSLDGSNWEDLGAIATDGFVVGVAATPFGLMAIESNPLDGSVAAWRSTDAMDWERTVIEQEDRNVTFFSNAIGANGSLVVVAGNTYDDGSSILEKKLADYGLGVDLQSVNWEIDSFGEDAEVHIYGPLGLPALSIPTSELGLTDEERQLVQQEMAGDGNTVVWSTDDGVTWVRSSIEGMDWVSSIAPSPDGGLLAFGTDSAGQGAWRTHDGVSWEKLPFGLRVGRATRWRDQLVGLGSQGLPEVFLSSDGETWDPLGLADEFPRRISWFPTEIATSNAVIGVTIQGYPPGSVRETIEAPTPVVLERNGTTLTIDLDRGAIEFDDGESIRSWHLYGSSDNTDPEGLVVDLVGRTVTFLDSAGQELVTFGFDELMRAQSDYILSTYGRDFTFEALAYTQDARSWAIQDLDEAFGEGTQVIDLIATPFTLMAAVQPADVFYGSGQGELQIWSAPLP
jgi:hypothetical protein